MRDLYIKNGQGFIIVYSLTSRQSFQDIKLIREQILRVKGTDRVPIVLVANKCDLSESCREVSTDDGCSLANQWSIPYIETSAKNSTIVNGLFTEIVKEMNYKSNSHHSSHGRKEKKKFKKLNNLTMSSHNDTQNSITFSHKKIIDSKQKNTNSRFSSICCCRKSFSPCASVNSSNDSSKPDSICSIL